MKGLWRNWFRILGLLGLGMVLYSFIMGLLVDVPALYPLNETIRNLFYHVTMWFAMMSLLIISLVYSVKYLLRAGKQETDMVYDSSRIASLDIAASQAVVVALFFGALGLITGSIWAKNTWGTYWTFADPKLNGALLGVLLYLVYLILRRAIDDAGLRAKVSAVFNIFAFVMYMVFVNVIPRMQDSLHPGMGGNPGFSSYDTTNDMRMVFYPAVLGWILIGVWMFTLRTRIKKLESKVG